MGGRSGSLDQRMSDEDDIQTGKFRPPHVALSVRCAAAVIEKCSAILGIPVLKVGHASAACERMVTTRPLVVIAGLGLSRDDLAALRARSLDTGAQLVVLQEIKDEAQLPVHLQSAKRAALISRGE